MDIQEYYRLVKDEVSLERVHISSLRNIIEQYPYFQSAIFMYLKALYCYDSNYYKEELAHLSISVNDRKALFYYILSEEYKQFFEQTGKREIAEDKTNILLDAFFGNKLSDDDLELEYNISNSSLASTDYLTYLEIESNEKIAKEPVAPITEDTHPLKHQNIIDSFIQKSEEDGGIRIQIEKSNSSYLPEISEEANNEGDELNEDVFFTETLSKIYIKQKKYEKAYKIIKHLSLNYPKKNIYFADQLIFLEKLIINSKYKDKK